MKTNNKYFNSDRRQENLKKEEEDDNEENEEEEDDEELDSKNKETAQEQSQIQLIQQQPPSRPLIKKEVKSTIIKREPRLLNQIQNPIKQRIIPSTPQNQESNNSKENLNIRRAIQDRKLDNHPPTPASRIILRASQGMGKNPQFAMKLTQSSSRTQIKVDNPQNLTRPLRGQNSQTQLPIRPKIPVKNENQSQSQIQKQGQSQAPLYQSRYSRKVIDNSVPNDNNNNNNNNNKEIKIINKNNNYTINVTNNNNTFNVSNNNNNEINSNNDINNEKTEVIKDKEEDKEEKEEKKEEKEEINSREIEPKRETKKEPRKDILKEPRREERIVFHSNNINNEKEVTNKNDNLEKENNKIKNKENKEEKNNINNSEKIKKSIEDKNETKKKFIVDRRKEYVTNETLAKNGVEIVKFTPEETQRVFEKKAKAQELRKKNKEKKKKKLKLKKVTDKTSNNAIKDNYNSNPNLNYHKANYVFYKRGRDNFSKNIFDRENFYKMSDIERFDDDFDDYNNIFEYDEDYRKYNNNTFNRFDFKGRDFDDNRNNHRRINNFYERGRPNPIFRGNRGRRGLY